MYREMRGVLVSKLQMGDAECLWQDIFELRLTPDANEFHLGIGMRIHSV